MIADIVGNRTIKSQWDETVEYYGDYTFLTHIAMDETERSYTYNEFDKLVKQTANLFIDLGIRKGEFVGLHLLRNKPEYVLCWLALAQVGAVTVPMNENYKFKESQFVITRTGMTHLITETAKAEQFLNDFDGLNLDKLILIDGEIDDPRVSNLYKEIPSQSTTLQREISLSPQDTAVILFTSGTTSHPKGAIYTHCSVIYGGLFHASQIGICVGDRFLTVMPCYHMDFQEMALTPCICAGANLIMVEHYSARRFWRQVVEHKAHFTDTMSFMNRTMMAQPVQPWEKDHCLKQVYFSMGLSNEEKETFEKRFNVRLLNSYGMTETVSAVTCVPIYGDQHWPSVGRPALSYDIKIIDERGNTLPANQEGEICVHGIPGQSLIKGYLNDEASTKKLLDNEGWLHSGDFGYLDEGGWLFFMGRCGNMIKRSGENVSCSEVETIISSHPSILDAAVIGVPDPLRDQAVKAFVQLRRGHSLTKEEVIDYCKKNLADYKVPTVVEFVDEFPRTATGKIKKNLLS